jgi:hypothetical protein
MSQQGLVDIEGSHPQIPTEFITDSGTAVPIANQLEVLGGTGITTSGSGNTVTISLTSGNMPIDTISVQAGTSPVNPDGSGNVNLNGTVVAAGSTPIQTDGTGPNTIDIEVQLTQGIIASDATKVGLASFNSADFTVDANGFVALAGGAAGETITGDTGGALSPVLGNWNVLGGTVAAGTAPVRTNGSGNTLTVDVQKSQAIAATDATKIGLSNFDSAAFDVDANGFVQLNGGGIAATSFDVQANTGPGTDPVVPSAAGVVTVNGAAVANHSVVLETRSRAANAYNLEVQYATSAAATDATKSGVAHFDSAKFSVDASGFVTTSGTGVPNTITGDTGGALSPTAGNWNLLGSGSITTAGSGSTLTTQLTGLTNHAVLVGAGTTTITKVGPTATAGQVLQSAGSLADPAFSTATYPSTATGTGTILRADGTNWVATTATYPATTTINQLLYSSANNVVSGLTTANNGVVTTGTTGTPVVTALSSNGQLIIGSGSGAPAAATLTPGTGISITNAANSITIASSGSSMTWTVITADQSAVAMNGYICNKAGLLTLTLPASGAIGDIIEVTGINTALGWKIAQNANQQIFFGTTSTTVGTGGSIASINIRDSIKIVCVVSGASTVWNVISSVGNMTVT